MSITSQRIPYFLVLALVKILLFPHSTLAQGASTLKQKVFDTETEIYLPQKSDRLKVDLSSYTVNSDEFNLEQLPARIQVNRLKIIGNSVFSPAELAALVNLKQKQTISKSDLRQIIQHINQAYRDRGYVTSGIFDQPKLQPQGIILIPITEGKIADVKITGLNRLRANYIRKRIVRNQEQIINQEQLNKALQQLQVNRLIKNISATISPGSNIGDSILEVEVQEDDHFYVELGLDNLGNLNFGSFRRQIEVNHDSLLGFGDRFNAAYTNSDGSNALNNLSYVFPINPHDGTIGFSYGFGALEFIREPFNVLDIDFEFSTFELNFRQPVYQTPEQELALGLALSRIATETTLLDDPFPLVAGASSDGELNVSAISFYQDYTKRGTKDRLDLHSEIRFGANIFDATNNDDSPDTIFFIWRGQTSYHRKLTDDLTLSFKSLFQLSDRPLVFSETIPRILFIDGRESETFMLRGYPRNALTGDNGIFASAELLANVLKIERLNSIFQLTPFVDFGTAGNNDDLELAESTLISLGLGLRLLVNDNFRARVDWGIPLIDLDFDTGSLQEDGVTFNIEYRPL